MPPKGGAIVQALVSIVIVAIGALVVFAFIKLRKRPGKMEQDKIDPLVKVEQLEVRDIPIVISGYGAVSPKVQVEIVPEVSGKSRLCESRAQGWGFRTGRCAAAADRPP